MMNKIMIFYWEVLKESISKYFNEDMTTHVAALSYFMLFSLPSMLLIVLWTAAVRRNKGQTTIRSDRKPWSVPFTHLRYCI